MSAVAATAAGVGRRALPWREVLVLLKLRIALLIVLTAEGSALAAGARDGLRLGVLALAATASSCGAGALNHYLDRELDARMARTRGRPLPSGRLRPRTALALGLSLVAASALAGPALGAVSVACLVAGALTYVVVYTWWLKPRTPFGVVWGGAAGSFAALAGWSLAAPIWAFTPLLLADVLFLWTPTHFWSLAIKLEPEYRDAGVPMLPVVAGRTRTARVVLLNTVALVASSLVLGAFLPWPFLATAAVAGAWFLWLAARLDRDPSPERAFSLFKLSGPYLLVVLVGLVAARLL